MSSENSVAILGTGDFGRALGKRLLQSGCDVTYGSRYPSKRNLGKIDESLLGAKVVSIEEALVHSNVVFMAVNVEAYSSFAIYQDLVAGKVLIDISNSPQKPKVGSNAERLSALFPAAKVVKAFNTVSAYSLQSDAAGNSRQVLVCGDDPESRETVKSLARKMGFNALDCGGLSYAKELESRPHTLLDGWGWPSLVVLIFFVWWTLYAIAHYYWITDSPTGLDTSWKNLPCYIMNKVTGCVSVTLLALCYLPGCLAAFLQLIRGTKYKRFPDWLDAWLKMRKQLGLYALLFATIHMILSLILINEKYYDYWFRAVLPGQTASTMNLDGELTLLLGALAIVTMGIVGLTSLPSVGAALNWKEWTFSQSYIGWLCLLLAISHVTVKGAHWWHFMVTNKQYGAGWKGVVQTLSFTSMLIPWLTLFLKLILVIPCLNCHLWSIRRGYERGNTEDPEVPTEGSLAYSTVTRASSTKSAPRLSFGFYGNGTGRLSNGNTRLDTSTDDLGNSIDFFQGGQENWGYRPNIEESERL